MWYTALVLLSGHASSLEEKSARGSSTQQCCGLFRAAAGCDGEHELMMIGIQITVTLFRSYPRWQPIRCHPISGSSEPWVDPAVSSRPDQQISSLPEPHFLFSKGAGCNFKVNATPCIEDMTLLCPEGFGAQITKSLRRTVQLTTLARKGSRTYYKHVHDCCTMANMFSMQLTLLSGLTIVSTAPRPGHGLLTTYLV